MIRLFDTKERRLGRLPGIKLVACDLDGTLLDDANEIAPGIAEAVEALRERGVDVILASGRTPAFTLEYVKQLGLPTPAIALNGGIATFGGEEPAVFCSAVPAGIPAFVGAFGEETETPFEITAFTPRGLFATSEEATVPKYLRAGGDPVTVAASLAETENEIALYVVYGGYAAIQQLSVAIAKKYGTLVRRVAYPSKMQRDRSYLEIQGAKVNKGTALSYICKTLRISKQTVAAIGDFVNDIEMLRYAGVAAAVNNAMDEIKDIADIVTEKDNTEGGVAEFFTLLLDAKAQ